MTKVPQWKHYSSRIWLAILTLAVLMLHFQLLTADAAGLRFDLRNEGPNRIDQGRMVRGYYQNLNETVEESRGGIPERIADFLVAGKTAPQWAGRLSSTGASRTTKEGYLLSELIPGADVEHLGIPMTINRWGQRDRDYELAKASDTFRIAFIGSSNSMGWGVRLEEGFVERLEVKLNAELVGKGKFTHYEVINFSAPGYSAPEFLYVAEELAAKFNPDLIIIENCAEEVRFNITERVAARFLKGRDLRYAYVREVVDSAGVSQKDELFRLKRRLMPLKQALLTACYRHLGEWSRQVRVPVAVALLRLEVAPDVDPLLEWSESVAREQELIPIRVFNAFAGGEPAAMYLATEKDRHPSAKAHALLADDLYEQLLTEPQTRNLLLGGAMAKE